MTADSRLPARLLPDTSAVGDDGWLRVGGCSVRDLAAEFGTPLFVYDEQHVRARCREAVAAFGPGRAIYATKAFLCRAMARLAYDEGMRLDVATEGELHVALAAGVPASACVMHGNNKSVAELRRAQHAVGHAGGAQEAQPQHHFGPDVGARGLELRLDEVRRALG